jgi:2-methylcitrate dehydratase PrpD
MSTAAPSVLDADALVDRVAAVTWDRLGEPTRQRTRSLVLDALGLAAAAPAAPSLAATARAHRRTAGATRPGDGVAVPFGEPTPGPVEAAAALSVAVHAWDFDDTHDEAVVHTACVALPAALATAQECGADGRRVLEGVVAGVEVLSRLGLAVGARPGVVRTAGLGSLAAAAATARVLGLDAAATHDALGLALPAALSPTTRQVVLDSAVSKRHQPSHAVRAGVGAAYLAAEGVGGAAGWWSGEHGLSSQAAGDAGLAGRAGWEVDRVSLKPVPACRYAHAAVAGVLDLTGGRALGAEGAEHVPPVRVHLPVGSNHVVVARPFERRGTPIVDAQFSVPWLVAAALVRGRVGLPEMTPDVLRDPVVEAVARTRVEVVQDQDPGTAVLVPVVVTLDGTTTVVGRVPGSPSAPLGDARQRDKVLGCLEVAGRSPAVAATEAVALARLVDDLEHLDHTQLVDRLLTLGPAGGTP